MGYSEQARRIAGLDPDGSQPTASQQLEKQNGANPFALRWLRTHEELVAATSGQNQAGVPDPTPLDVVDSPLVTKPSTNGALQESGRLS